MFRLIQIVLIFAFIFVVFGQDVKPEINEKNEDRIVGGLNAAYGQFKYQASLRYNARHFCGGSIYSNRWVITAGHCIDWMNSTSLPNFHVFVGTILSNIGIAYTVRRVIVHPDYVKSPTSNDIGLVQTTGIIFFNTLVDRIPLHRYKIGSGVQSVVSGWGLTSYPGSVPLNLQYLTVYTISNNYCSSILSRINNSDICTIRSVGYGVCVGDSGGPLAYQDKLIGVVSRGVLCAKGYPDVYTRISQYFTWITSTAI